MIFAQSDQFQVEKLKLLDSRNSPYFYPFIQFFDNSPDLPPSKNPDLDKFWVMCGDCNHGGHAECYSDWFKRIGMPCPYNECNCLCNNDTDY